MGLQGQRPVARWLRHLFRLDRPPRAAVAAPPPVRAPPPPARPDAGAAPADPFEPFAQALGIELPLVPPPLSEELERQEQALCERVLEHCRANKLGPASSPTLSLRILNLVASPNAEIAELSRVISADAALTGGILKVANSAALRGRDPIESVRTAVARLGLEEVGRVAGVLSARSLFSPKLRHELRAYGPFFAALYQRAATIASAASALAMRAGARSDRAYLGGMLHDVGRTVALGALAHLEGEKELCVDPAMCQRVVDRVHVAVGAEVHQGWELPDYLLVLAVRHHDVQLPPGPEFRDLHVVRLTAAVHDVLWDPAAAPRAAREIVESAAALRLDANAVRALAGELRQAEERVQATFHLAPAPGT